jgi:hypothetical protein
MKNSYAYAAAVAVLLAAAPFASASDDDKAAGPSTTVTGCVTTTNDGKNFVLTEATKGMQSPPKTWTLVATGSVDLAKYANHKVEITGTSDKADASATAPTSSTAAGATADTKFKVKEVKDISNSCS